MANVVREDIVKISFEIADNPLSKLTAGMDKLKASVVGAESGLDGIKDTAKKAAAGVEGIKDAAKGIGDIAKAADEASGGLKEISDTASDLKGQLTFDDIIDVSGLSEAADGLREISDAANDLKGQLAFDFDDIIDADGLTEAAKGIEDIAKEADKAQEGLEGLKQSSEKVKDSGKKFKGIGSTIKDAWSKTKDWAAALKEAAATKFNQLKSGIVSVSKSLGGGLLRAAGVGMGALAAGAGVAVAGINNCMTALGEQTAMETQLATTAKNMGISDEAIKSIKDYAGELQNVTMYGDEAMIGAAAEAATYFTDPEAIKGLMKTVTDYAAGMSGGTALSTQEIVDYTTNLAKMTTGAYDAMTKKGFEVTDAQKKILENGTDMEKVAVIQDIIGASWDGMAQSFVNTPTGKLTQMKNLFGDLKEKIGAVFSDKYVAVLGVFTDALSGLNDVLANGFQAEDIGALSDIFSGLATKGIEAVNTYLPKLMDFIVPAVTRILSGITQIIPGVANSLMQGVTSIFAGLLDVFRTSGPQIMLALTNGINQAVISLLGMMPQFVTVAGQLITALGQGLAQAAPSLIPAVVECIMGMIDAIMQMLPQLVVAGLQLLIGLAQGVVQAIPQLVAAIPTVITNFINAVLSNLPTIIQLGIQLIVSLAVGLIQAIPQLLSAIPQIIKAIWDGLTSVNWLDLGWQIIKGIGGGIVDGIKSLFGGGKKAGKGAVDGISTGISIGAPQVQSSASALAADAVPSFAAIGNTMQYGTAAAGNLAMGITVGTGSVQSAASNMASMAAGSMKLDTAAMTINGQNAATDMASGITANAAAAVAAASDMAAGVEAAGQADVAVNLSVDQSGLAASSEAVSSFVAEMQSAVGQIPQAFDTAMGTASQTATAKMTEIKTANNGMKDCLAAVKNGLGQIPGIAEAAGASATAFGGDFNAAAGQVETSVNKMTAAVENGKNKMVASIENAMSEIKSTINSTNLYSSGVNLINGLVNGINAKKSAAVSAARSVANAINAEFNKIQKIHSPSKVWEEKGEFLIQGGVIGMEKQMPKMRDAAREAGEISVPYLRNYTPENSGSTYYSRSSSEEYNSYAPVFNLTINGGNEDERSLARKVKRFVKEGIEDTFESLSRKQPKPRRA